MVYDNDEEMNNVLGKFDDNSFIKQQKTETELFVKKVNKLLVKS